MTRILVTDYAWPSLDVEREILAAAGAELVVAESGEEDELTELARGVEGILTNWKRVPVAALEAAPGCLIVSRFGIGVDNIPVADATRLGIVVTNVPDFCVDELAEHAMALLLALARRVVPFARSTGEGRWELALGRTMRRLRGKTLGLVGYGKGAQALAEKARAFGMEIVAFTPRLLPEALQLGGRATNDLEELLAEADFVSLHVPLTAQTRGLVDRSFLERMKPTAFLINTSRGAVIDEQALREAVAGGRIAGAGLDVLTQEPPPQDHPLLGIDNVIVTPHAAFWSEEAIADLCRRATEQVVQALRGELPANVVNPEVLDRRELRLSRAGL